MLPCTPVIILLPTVMEYSIEWWVVGAAERASWQYHSHELIYWARTPPGSNTNLPVSQLIHQSYISAGVLRSLGVLSSDIPEDIAGLKEAECEQLNIIRTTIR